MQLNIFPFSGSVLYMVGYCQRKPRAEDKQVQPTSSSSMVHVLHLLRERSAVLLLGELTCCGKLEPDSLPTAPCVKLLCSLYACVPLRCPCSQHHVCPLCREKDCGFLLIIVSEAESLVISAVSAQCQASYLPNPDFCLVCSSLES